MIGWIGNAFIAAGLWGVGSKRRRAFLLSCVGETLYIVRSLWWHDWALLVACVIFFGLALRGYVSWKTEEAPKLKIQSPTVSIRSRSHEEIREMVLDSVRKEWR